MARHDVLDDLIGYQDRLRQMTDDQVRMAVRIVAHSFSLLRTEAQRRGLWDELKTLKVKDRDLVIPFPTCCRGGPMGGHAHDCVTLTSHKGASHD